MRINVREEKLGDEPAIRDLLVSAFPTDQEARLVDRLRANGKLIISLVADGDGEIIGQIAFSPVIIEQAGSKAFGLGLAPMAVRPALQNQGVGSRLIRAGLLACEAAGAGFVVVLGEPDYYRRFGFQRASLRGITNAYGVDEPFMAMEIHSGSLNPGLALYAPEFADLAHGTPTIT